MKFEYGSLRGPDSAKEAYLFVLNGPLSCCLECRQGLLNCGHLGTMSQGTHRKFRFDAFELLNQSH